MYIKELLTTHVMIDNVQMQLHRIYLSHPTHFSLYKKN